MSMRFSNKLGVKLLKQEISKDNWFKISVFHFTDIVQTNFALFYSYNIIKFSKKQGLRYIIPLQIV